MKRFWELTGRYIGPFLGAIAFTGAIIGATMNMVSEPNTQPDIDNVDHKYIIYYDKGYYQGFNDMLEYLGNDSTRTDTIAIDLKYFIEKNRIHTKQLREELTDE